MSLDDFVQTCDDLVLDVDVTVLCIEQIFERFE